MVGHEYPVREVSLEINAELQRQHDDISHYCPLDHSKPLNNIYSTKYMLECYFRFHGLVQQTYNST
jgi:hypothetical protein